MTNKTIEILMYLLSYLKDNYINVESLSEFSESLVLSGYNEHDIEEAIDLLLEKHNVIPVKSTKVAQQQETSVRILSDFERLTVTPEVYGYLLKLRNLSIINSIQMEKILDYSMLISSRKITESDINEILATILFEEHINK